MLEITATQSGEKCCSDQYRQLPGRSTAIDAVIPQGARRSSEASAQIPLTGSSAQVPVLKIRSPRVAASSSVVKESLPYVFVGNDEIELDGPALAGKNSPRGLR
jgi:hypothetical protein